VGVCERVDEKISKNFQGKIKSNSFQITSSGYLPTIYCVIDFFLKKLLFIFLTFHFRLSASCVDSFEFLNDLIFDFFVCLLECNYFLTRFRILARHLLNSFFVGMCHVWYSGQNMTCKVCLSR
jgi:hypothetical protein